MRASTLPKKRRGHAGTTPADIFSLAEKKRKSRNHKGSWGVKGALRTLKALTEGANSGKQHLIRRPIGDRAEDRQGMERPRRRRRTARESKTSEKE